MCAFNFVVIWGYLLFIKKSLSKAFIFFNIFDNINFFQHNTIIEVSTLYWALKIHTADTFTINCYTLNYSKFSQATVLTI